MLSSFISRSVAAVLALMPLAASARDSVSLRAQDPEPPPEITVYAAASLREALTEIAAEYEKQHGAKIVFNFGSSGDLARQIIAANKADLFLSADEKEMDRVAADKLIDESTRTVLLSNQLVVIEPLDPKHPEASSFTTPFTAEQLAGPTVRHLSLADTDSVPAGRYARAWLEKKEIWPRVKDRVLPGVDVRAALAAVESGGAQAGIVYRTDAAISRRVRIAHVVPVAEGPKISYPIAVVRDRPRSAEARLFAQHLGSARALEVFERCGFVLPERERKKVK